MADLIVRPPGRTLGFLRATAKSAIQRGRFGLLRAFDFAERHGSGILFHFENCSAGFGIASLLDCRTDFCIVDI